MKKSLLIPLMGTIVAGSSLVTVISCDNQQIKKYSVTFDKTHSVGIESISAPEEVEEKQALTIKFTFQQYYVGFEEKKDINVLINGTEYKNFEYNPVAKEITIQQGVINGDVVISGTASEPVVGAINAYTEEGDIIASDINEIRLSSVTEGARISFWFDEPVENKSIILPLKPDLSSIASDAVKIWIDDEHDFDLTWNKDYTVDFDLDSYTCILTAEGANIIKEAAASKTESLNLDFHFIEVSQEIGVDIRNHTLFTDYANLPYNAEIYVNGSQTPLPGNTISIVDAFLSGFSVRYSMPEDEIYQTYALLNPDYELGDVIVELGEDIYSLDDGIFEWRYEPATADRVGYHEFTFAPYTVYDDIHPWMIYQAINEGHGSTFTFTPKNAEGSSHVGDLTINPTDPVDVLLDSDDKTFTIAMDDSYKETCKFEGDCVTIMVNNQQIESGWEMEIGEDNTTIDITFTKEAYLAFAGKSSEFVEIYVNAVPR